MKEVLVQLSSYNIWANRLLLEVVNKLPGEHQVKEVPSSFKSLYATLLHMYDAESIWWQRLKLQERISRPSESFTGTINDLGSVLLHQNSQWHQWITNAGQHQLEHVFQYLNLKGEPFKQPTYQMLLHVFNHGTYHRGQLVNILRQLGVEKIPRTDFIDWSRKK